MASLTGTKIKDTYDSLLKVSDNGALDGTLQQITDGLGNNSALSLSTAGASVTGTLAVSGNAAFDTNTLFVDSANNAVGVGTTSLPAKLTIKDGNVYIDRDTTSGVYAFGFYRSGAERGRVGFDYSQSSLQVQADGSINFLTAGENQRMFISSSGDISFRDSSANEAFYWDASAASLGIGTTSPATILDIRGSSPTINVNATNASGEAAINLTAIGSDGVSNALTQIAGIPEGAGLASAIKFQTRNSGGTISERMRIDSSGNVGIGTLSPASKAHVSFQADGDGIRLQNSTRGHNYLLTTAGSSAEFFSLYDVDNAKSLYQAGNTAHAFLTGGTERMRITSGGDLVVGKTSSSWAVNGLQTENSGTSIGVTNSDASNNLFLRKNGATGNIVAFYYDSSAVGTISITSSATSYNTSSDYRLKEDWVAMEGALDRVDALKPINFAWKADGSRVDGFLAHELAEVVPEAVTGEKDATEIRSVEVSPAVLDEEGNVITEAVYEEQEVPVYQGIDQSKIVPLLAAGLQEAHALIKELRAELNALKQA